MATTKEKHSAKVGRVHEEDLAKSVRDFDKKVEDNYREFFDTVPKDAHARRQQFHLWLGDVLKKRA